MRNLNWFFPVLILFLFSCSTEKRDQQVLQNGLYLVAGSDSPNPVLLLTNYDSSGTTALADSIPVFKQKDFRTVQCNVQKSSAEYQIGLSDREWTRLVFLEYSKASQKLAFVFDGKVVGTWTIPADTVRAAPAFPVVNYTQLKRLNDYCDSLLMYSGSVKFVTGRKPESFVGKSFYENGKLFSETKIENGLLCSRTYYENGDLASENIRDTTNFTINSDSSYLSLLLPGKRKVSETVNKSGLIFLIREYYGNGQLKNEWSDYQTAHQSPMLIREYENDGQLAVEKRSELLAVCGQEQEFNHPQVVHVRQFSGGKPVLAGDLFSSCGYDCEMDSIGTWQFFEDGKPVSERKFVSKQVRYDQYCRDIKQ